MLRIDATQNYSVAPLLEKFADPGTAANAHYSLRQYVCNVNLAGDERFVENSRVRLSILSPSITNHSRTHH